MAPDSDGPLRSAIANSSLGSLPAPVIAELTVGARRLRIRRRAIVHREGEAWPHLERSFRGDSVRPGDPSYDLQRNVWNGSIDRHPARVQRRVREAYGEVRYTRLQKLKRRYDPENVFRQNQNIQPA